MSDFKFYEDVKILKKPIKKRLKQVLGLFMFLSIIAISIIVARYISMSITVGNLGSFIVYGDTQLKIDENLMFAITLGEYDTFEEAEKVGFGASIQGAGGFVWEDEKFWVIGSVWLMRRKSKKI